MTKLAWEDDETPEGRRRKNRIATMATLDDGNTRVIARVYRLPGGEDWAWELGAERCERGVLTLVSGITDRGRETAEQLAEAAVDRLRDALGVER